MRQRILVVAALIAALLQGPVLAYSATVGALHSTHGIAVHGTATHCPGPVTAGSKDCCSHDCAPSCATICVIPGGWITPTAADSLALPLTHALAIPILRLTPFVDRTPTPALRPPIA